MRVLLIDDEEIALEVLNIMLHKLGDIEIVGQYTNPELAYDDLANLEVDIIFLDMEMGEIHGIDFAEKITSNYKQIEIIFVTAHPQFALDAFDVHAIDYLLKPISLKRLEKAVQKTKNRLNLLQKERNEVSDLEKTLYAYTMGSFRLMDKNGDIIKWRTKKVQDLFVLLWHHEEEPIHKARLIEALWPDVDVTKAVSLLHTTVYLLRKVLRSVGLEKPIEFVNDHYKMKVSIMNDKDTLFALLNKQQILLEDIEKVLELYTDHYLAENDYGWIISRQQQIKQMTLDYLERVVTHKRSMNLPDFLLEKCLNKIFQLDIYNIKNILMLMEHYGHKNQLKDLQIIFKKIKLAFNDELGIQIPIEIVQKYNSYLK